MKKVKSNLVIACILFMAFVLFTIGVKIIDVQAIGPQDSFVGYATLNGFVFKLFKANTLWDKLTDVIFLLALLEAFMFAVKGCIQLFKRKNIAKVDQELLVLGGFYGLMIVIYFFFEKVVINMRPVLIDNVLEPSYPSSHTMITLFILLSGVMMVNMMKISKKAKKMVSHVSFILMVVVTLGRCLSGMHWMSDIVGAVLLSFSLSAFFSSALRYLKSINKKEGREKE